MSRYSDRAPFTRPCLVDIHTQTDFVLPGGACHVPGAEALIPVWKALTAFGAEFHLPMVATLQSSGGCLTDMSAGTLATSSAAKLPETLLPAYQVLAAAEQDATLDFHVQLILETCNEDVFQNAQADAVFASAACSAFVVYGVPIETSVKSAVLGLLERGHRVYVVTDAIRARDAAVGERTLADLANAGAAFISSAALMEKVRQQKETA
ncbi:MAG: isochorismatase family protein [Candidatus Sumerlaeia bacterium]|nr:isochorismatase family protein [Candidatus Sumerlaeia bacterium]